MRKRAHDDRRLRNETTPPSYLGLGTDLIAAEERRPPADLFGG